MIQVSTPITNTQEGSLPEPLKKTGAEKKEPLGVFAKLLAGLLRNRRDPAGITGKAEAGELGGGNPALGENPAVGEASTGGEGKIPSRNRKKAAPAPADREMVAALLVSPEKAPIPPEPPLPQDALPQSRALEGEEGAAPKGASPVPAGFRGNGEGNAAPPPGPAAGTGLPEEAAGAGGADLDAAAVLDAGPERKADKDGGPRDRKTAAQAGPRTAAESALNSAGVSGKIADNAEALRVQWGGMSPGTKPEKEAPRDDRVAEGRARDRRRERLGLELRDFRTPALDSAGELKGTVSGGNETGRGGTDLWVELPGGDGGLPGDGASPETTGGQERFESLLARELRQDLSGDIVRSAQIILRDGGAGTIRLSLKPESLGNVKIRLEMAENKIMGHIIVENDETLRAFEQEIHTLEQAFLDAGFDGADLDTALASGDGRNGAGGEGKGEQEHFLFSRQLAAASYDLAPGGGEETGAGGYTGYGISRQINMLI